LLKPGCCCCCCCRSVLHIHTIVEECEVTKLVHAVDMKTKEPKKVGRGGGWGQNCNMWYDLCQHGSTTMSDHWTLLSVVMRACTHPSVAAFLHSSPCSRCLSTKTAVPR
jgi:hypothetical protein